MLWGLSGVVCKIHCEVTRELWSSILNLFGVEWVIPRQARDLLVS